MEADITLGGILLGRDFWLEGRNLGKLGPNGKTSEEIREFSAS
jgi:hypothetical protein